MEPISLREAAEAVKGTLAPTQAGDLLVKEVSTDTRTITSGGLFVPLKGDNFDGHDFIDKAARQGALAYFTEGRLHEANGASIPSIRVESTLDAYMNLARYYRQRIEPVVVGITGSNGKTTTKEMLGQVLSDVAPTIYSERSFNNFVGLPATLFRIHDDVRYAVLEMGTNSPGEIGRLARIAAPEIGIITNISPCHLEGLKDVDGIAKEKASLLTHLQGRAVSILNRDDPSFDFLASKAPGKVVTFSLCHRADFMAIDMDVNFEGIRFEVAGVKVKLPVLGVHNIYNALAVFACAAELDITPERIATAFARYESPPMRLKPIRKGSLLVIDDAYNANPGSMDSAIKTFSVLPVKGRKVVVLGDMMELGKDSRALHRQVGGQLSCGQFDLVAAVGEQSQEYIAGAMEHGLSKKGLITFSSTQEAIQELPGMLKAQDSILVKGSRKMGLEKLIESVLATDI